MKTELWVTGKTTKKYIQEGMDIFLGRLKHYLPFNLETIPDIKGSKKISSAAIKQKESEAVLKKLKPGDFLVLLDEKGEALSSVELAGFMKKRMQASDRRMIFLIGGAFGVSKDLYNRTDYRLSLSKMTFSHQMVRVFFLEQLYRAMTIIRNEPYHNQ